MRTPTALLVLLGLPFAARADPVPPAVQLVYDGYTSGFHVLSITTDLNVTTTGYQIEMTGHTAGMVGVMYHARWHTVSDGRWAGPDAVPLHYDNEGVFGGEPRHVAIDYMDGDPVLRALVPLDDHEHGPVPAALQKHTIDGLSVLALAMHQIMESGTCGGAVTTFDGRSVEARTLHTVGMEQLPATSRSSFQGPALRCDIDSRVLAGFFHNDPNEPQRAYTDSMWFARISPELPPLPVRFTATTHHIGRTLLYLTSMTLHPPGAMAATRP